MNFSSMFSILGPRRIDLIFSPGAFFLFLFADSCAFLSQPASGVESRFRFRYLVCCLIGRKLKNKQAAPKANTTRWRLPGQRGAKQPPSLAPKWAHRLFGI